ncbi:hypothetical protein BG910_01510 [Neisseria chenwenguii]|uniref:Uncharacterized protein n=1 Tax=Neisseria chenwenguii TaxID=1853278 RepID=A0A220RZQ6_9NEIS|nr:S-layer family protein [Neisseria chenwenguii]ASK26596.1 hypothetical protein BG910_01510 [Neisseria chenwenguii]ROV55391.1 S-layer family protein [Neisseria chenwenguii]
MKKEDHDLNLYRYDGTNIPFHKYAVESLRKSDYIQSVYKQRIVENRPSEIIVGGSLQADGGNWLNKDSFILSGGTIGGTAFINNEPSKQTVRTVNDGFSRRGSYDKHGSRGSRHIEFDKDVIPVSAIPPASADFEVPVSEVRQNTAALSFAGQPQAAAVSTAAVSPEGSTKVLMRSLPQASALPSGSLFTVDSARPDYLAETDPAFTDRRQWLGSSYMLKALGQDTANTQKRLGDGSITNSVL